MEKRDVIEIWKKIVDVQQHFNEIEMRIRGFFITFVIAASAAYGFLLEKDFVIGADYLSLRYSTLIPIIGTVITYLFYFMDRFWYHRLLTGAVKQAIKIENKYNEDMPEISLSESIGLESPVRPNSKFLKIVTKIPFVVTDTKWKKEGKLHSNAKIEIFYKLVIVIFFAVFMIEFLFGGVRLNDKAIGDHFLEAIFYVRRLLF